jgi:hypothetical protein
MAAAIGIDLSNADDQMAQMVRTAISDLNPSRALRDCEHVFVTVRPMGLVATWLRLPTMGQKAIHCDLHRYSVVGGTLDGAYRSFKKSYCAVCPDASPRPPDWKYSPEWQEAENERHKGRRTIRALQSSHQHHGATIKIALALIKVICAIRTLKIGCLVEYWGWLYGIRRTGQSLGENQKCAVAIDDPQPCCVGNFTHRITWGTPPLSPAIPPQRNAQAMPSDDSISTACETVKQD